MTGPIAGYPPTIIISQDALAALHLDTYIYKTCVYYNKAYDTATQSRVEQIVADSKDARCMKMVSKIESMEELKAGTGKYDRCRNRNLIDPRSHRCHELHQYDHWQYCKPQEGTCNIREYRNDAKADEPYVHAGRKCLRAWFDSCHNCGRTTDYVGIVSIHELYECAVFPSDWTNQYCCFSASGHLCRGTAYFAECDVQNGKCGRAHSPE